MKNLSIENAKSLLFENGITANKNISIVPSSFSFQVYTNLLQDLTQRRNIPSFIVNPFYYQLLSNNVYYYGKVSVSNNNELLSILSGVNTDSGVPFLNESNGLDFYPATLVSQNNNLLFSHLLPKFNYAENNASTFKSFKLQVSDCVLTNIGVNQSTITLPAGYTFLAYFKKGYSNIPVNDLLYTTTPDTLQMDGYNNDNQLVSYYLICTNGTNYFVHYLRLWGYVGNYNLLSHTKYEVTNTVPPGYTASPKLLAPMINEDTNDYGISFDGFKITNA